MANKSGVGLSVYDVTAADLVDLAGAADAAGFSSLWLGEHVVLPVGYASDHPTTGGTAEQHHRGPIVDPSTQLLDPLVALAGCATVTRSIGLATGIFLAPLRAPVVSARMVHTLHGLSGGRVMLGVGAGWLEEEFRAAGVPFENRGRRLQESIEIMRLAWQGGPFSYRSELFDTGEVQLCEAPITVPVIMGGNSDAALRRAARLGDGWFASGTPEFDDACRMRDKVMAMRAAAGAGGAGGADRFQVHVRVPGADPEMIERYSAAGFDSVMVWADQVWPAQAASGAASGAASAKRGHLMAAAGRLGLPDPAHRLERPGAE